VTASELAAAVAAKQLSATEAVDDSLSRLGAHGHLNAVITVCGEHARARARAGVSGPLSGVPLLVKDLIDTRGIRTTYASAVLRDHVPEHTAPSVEALEAAGAIVVAKSNADEFAWGVTGQNAHWGDVENPRRPGRIAGGSSAGNAAALAAGLVPLALGTDTGGSIRMPAAACDVIGLKPPLGAISVEGVFPLAPSFDTVGPMGRTVTDCALAHSVLTRTPVPEPRLADLSVGVLTRLPEVAPPTGETIRDERALAYAERLGALGARVVEVELPAPDGDIWPLFYVEARTAHRQTFPSRRDEYGPTIRAKLDRALGVGRAAGEEARRALRRWRRAAAAEPPLDLFLSPTLGTTELPEAGVDELAIRIPFSGYTRVFSFLGWPAIALGELQLASRDVATVIGAALALEREGALR
jgi:Asp-tRNA(Asn)/Glu-tRNA(Gln) amidotransferase A subunit family amidase